MNFSDVQLDSLGVVPLAQRECEMHGATEQVRLVGLFERHCAPRGALTGRIEHEVLAVGAHATRLSGNADTTRAEDRLAVVATERLEQRNLRGERTVDLVDRDLGVHDTGRAVAGCLIAARPAVGSRSGSRTVGTRPGGGS